MTEPLFANKNVSLPQDFQSSAIASHKCSHVLGGLLLLSEAAVYLLCLLAESVCACACVCVEGGKLPELPLEKKTDI